MEHQDRWNFFFLFDWESALSQISCFPSTFISTGVLKSHEMGLVSGQWSSTFIVGQKRLPARNVVQYARGSAAPQEDWQKEGLSFWRWLRLRTTIRTAMTKGHEAAVLCETLLCSGIYRKGARTHPFALRIQCGTDPRHAPQSLQHYVQGVNMWLFVEEPRSRWFRWTLFRKQLQAAHQSPHH